MVCFKLCQCTSNYANRLMLSNSPPPPLAHAPCRLALGAGSCLRELHAAPGSPRPAGSARGDWSGVRVRGTLWPRVKVWFLKPTLPHGVTQQAIPAFFRFHTITPIGTSTVLDGQQTQTETSLLPFSPPAATPGYAYHQLCVHRGKHGLIPTNDK